MSFHCNNTKLDLLFFLLFSGFSILFYPKYAFHCIHFLIHLVKYQYDMHELVSTRYNFKSPENPGTIPKKIEYQDKEYTLIEETHCAVCDNPQCQEMFQYQDDLETGLSMMFYPILPVYTHNREKELCALCLGL